MVMSAIEKGPDMSSNTDAVTGQEPPPEAPQPEEPGPKPVGPETPQPSDPDLPEQPPEIPKTDVPIEDPFEEGGPSL